MIRVEEIKKVVARAMITIMFLIILLPLSSCAAERTASDADTSFSNTLSQAILTNVTNLGDIDRNIGNNSDLDYVYISKNGNGLYKIDKDTLEVIPVLEGLNVYWPYVEGEYVYFYNNNDFKLYDETRTSKSSAQICRVALDGQDYEIICNVLSFNDFNDKWGITGDTMSLFFVHKGDIFYEITPIKQLVKYDVTLARYELDFRDFLSYAFYLDNFYYIERSEKRNRYNIYCQDLNSGQVDLLLPNEKPALIPLGENNKIHYSLVAAQNDSLFYYAEYENGVIGKLDENGQDAIIADNLQKGPNGEIITVFYTFDNTFYFAGRMGENQYALYLYDEITGDVRLAALLPWDRMMSNIIVIDNTLLYYGENSIETILINNSC